MAKGSLGGNQGKLYWLMPRMLRLGHTFIASARLPGRVQPYLQRITSGTEGAWLQDRAWPAFTLNTLADPFACARRCRTTNARADALEAKAGAQLPYRGVAVSQLDNHNHVDGAISITMPINRE